MSYRLALSGLGLTAAAVLAATGCRAARPGAYDEAGIAHGRAHHAIGGRGVHFGTPAGHAPVSGDMSHVLPRSLRGLAPRLRHLRTGAAVPPGENCKTVSLGPGRGSSMQCVQQSDQVITRKDQRAIRDGWPDDGGGSDGDGHRAWPDLGQGHDD